MKKLLLIFIALHLSIATAVVEADLYSGEVVVSSQSETDRDQAIPEALIQVLQKLSGQREMPLSPALDEALGNAGKLLLSFRYKNVGRVGPDGVIVHELRLIVKFMQAEVDRIVQQAGLRRWQQDRPAVQIWVVIDDGRERQMKPVEFDYAWVFMEDIAAMRGLPISWPELDEEEVQLIDLRLVWGGFTEYLVERGAPQDGVAIIAARREGPQWMLRWNLAIDGRTWSWHNSDQELMFALAQGIHQMTDKVSAKNAIAASEQNLWLFDITIGKLNGAEDYVSCLEYLQNLSLVNAVEILGADAARVHFRLQLNASSQYLVDAFNRGSVLSPLNTGSEYEYEFLQ